MTSAPDERQRRVESGLWQEPITHPRGPQATTIAAAMARHRVPGCAVAVNSDGEIAWSQGYMRGRGDQRR